MSQGARQYGDDNTPRFRAVLRPNRSLSRTGFITLMAAVGAVSFVAGTAFLLIGAWPVFGFFGLDVALIWLAFRLNYRDGRTYETIEIFERNLVLTRVDPKGRAIRHELNPYWARVWVSTAVNGRTDLRLGSHGKWLSFGRFLTDEERHEAAERIGSALARARTAPERN